MNKYIFQLRNMDSFINAVNPDYIEYKDILKRLHSMCRRVNYNPSNIEQMGASCQFEIYPLCDRFLELVNLLNIQRIRKTKVYSFAISLSDLME